MKNLILTILLFCTFSVYAEGQWIADAKTGCQVWNPDHAPGESVTWNGSCRDGKANGSGILQWYANGKIGDRYEGGMKEGQSYGRGVVLFADGRKLDGLWFNNKFIPPDQGVEIGANGVLQATRVVNPSVWVDPKTGLMWARCPAGRPWQNGTCPWKNSEGKNYQTDFYFIEALREAKASRIEGFSDWRLPTIDELVTQTSPVVAYGPNDRNISYCVVQPSDHPANQTLTGRVPNGNSAQGISAWTTGFVGDAKGVAESVWKVKSCDTNEMIKTAKIFQAIWPGKYPTFGSMKIEIPTLENGKSRIYQHDYGDVISWQSKDAWNDQNRSSQLFLVRGGPLSKSQLVANAVLDQIDFDTREAKRQTMEAQANAEREQKMHETRIAREEIAFTTLLRSNKPRDMYLTAVQIEDKGEKGKAKTLYRELMKRYASSQEALLASQRLTRLSDVEAVESSNSRTSAASYEAAESSRKQSYYQCINDRDACYSRCRGIKDYGMKSSCESGCSICQQ